MSKNELNSKRSQIRQIPLKQAQIFNAQDQAFPDGKMCEIINYKRFLQNVNPALIRQKPIPRYKYCNKAVNVGKAISLDIANPLATLAFQYADMVLAIALSNMLCKMLKNKLGKSERRKQSRFVRTSTSTPKF